MDFELFRREQEGLAEEEVWLSRRKEGREKESERRPEMLARPQAV